MSVNETLNIIEVQSLCKEKEVTIEWCESFGKSKGCSEKNNCPKYKEMKNA